MLRRTDTCVNYYVNSYVNMLTSPETRPHHSITVSQMGIPGVHHRKRPQDMTEMNKNQLKLKGNNQAHKLLLRNYLKSDKVQK